MFVMLRDVPFWNPFESLMHRLEGLKNFGCEEKDTFWHNFFLHEKNDCSALLNFPNSIWQGKILNVNIWVQKISSTVSNLFASPQMSKQC